MRSVLQTGLGLLGGVLLALLLVAAIADAARFSFEAQYADNNAERPVVRLEPTSMPARVARSVPT